MCLAPTSQLGHLPAVNVSHTWTLLDNEFEVWDTFHLGLGIRVDNVTEADSLSTPHTRFFLYFFFRSKYITRFWVVDAGNAKKTSLDPVRQRIWNMEYFDGEVREYESITFALLKLAVHRSFSEAFSLISFDQNTVADSGNVRKIFSDTSRQRVWSIGHFDGGVREYESIKLVLSRASATFIIPGECFWYVKTREFCWIFYSEKR